MMGQALKVRELSFTYKTEPILAGVSFDISKGEFVSIIGPNGAGKSTLIKCLNKVITGWSGEVSIFGRSVLDMDQRKLAEQVGYVPQLDGRSLPFTVEEFVMMGRYPYMNPFTYASREDRKIVRDTLKETGMDRFADRYVDSLSGGEKQIVFIAAALVQGAKILLLDEPTTFLDYKHQVECSNILERLHCEHGVTIVSVTHDINHAITLSNRIIALKNGQLCFEGTPNELTHGRKLESIYETQFTIYMNEESDSVMLIPYGGKC